MVLHIGGGPGFAHRSLETPTDVFFQGLGQLVFGMPKKVQHEFKVGLPTGRNDSTHNKSSGRTVWSTYDLRLSEMVVDIKRK